MLKSLGQIARFMDGIHSCFGLQYLYVYDAAGKERVGFARFPVDTAYAKPKLILGDITSGVQLEFEGDYIKSPTNNSSLIWYPGIVKAAALYNELDNPSGQHLLVQSMQEFYRQFIVEEVLFQTFSANGGAPLGELEKHRIAEKLDFASSVYAFSIQYSYAGIEGNNDVLRCGPLLNIERDWPGIRKNLKNKADLSEFLAYNPEFTETLADIKTGENGTYYRTPSEVMLRIKRDISDEVLDAGYRQFRSELNETYRLPDLRLKYPKEALDAERRRQKFETTKRIGLTTFEHDLEHIK